jgi:ABC-type transporter Mla maintaining outer membrane lipid asymmetry ATPase subunit MlaF
MNLFKEKDVKVVESWKLKNVSLTIDNDHWLSHLDLEIPANKLYWIDSEIRNSMFLKLIAGLQKPTSGKLFINELDFWDCTYEETISLRLNMGYLFDSGGLFNNKSIFENHTLPLEYHGVDPKEIKDRVNNYLDKFDLMRFKDIRPAMVPGAVRKKACISRLLTIDPQVLFLDNPISGIGEHAVDFLVEWLKIKSKQSQMTLFISTEHNDFVKRISNDFVQLNLNTMKVDKAV